ncbi:MAG: HAD hydrolase family protein, partial [Thermodesulfobacteriota bacterium]|nr:HAD hydrolase family protein [Thermodesulfobacteriota bacterium]
YKAGDTLKLVLPFLMACGATNKKMEEFSESTLMLLPGAKDMLSKVAGLMPTFIISTSYCSYLHALCKVSGFPEDQVYCTAVDLDQYELTEQEQNRLEELASEIAGQPLVSWPEETKNIKDLSNENLALVSRLDTIFWEEIPKMRIGKILSDINPVGGFEKARAVENSLKKTGLTLSEVLYVGDSITDVQALELVRNAEGVAVSFNGNRYSIKAAKWACICGNTTIIGAIARLLTLNGMEAMIELMADMDSDYAEGTGFMDALASMGVEPVFLEPLRLLRDKDAPRIFLVNSTNISDVIKDSEYMRKNVRGLRVGELG